MFIAGILEAISCVALILAPGMHGLAYLFAVGFALGTILFGFLVGRFGYSIGWYLTIVEVIVGYAILLFPVNEINKKNKKIISKDNKDINKK